MLLMAYYSFHAKVHLTLKYNLLVCDIFLTCFQKCNCFIPRYATIMLWVQNVIKYIIVYCASICCDWSSTGTILTTRVWCEDTTWQLNPYAISVCKYKYFMIYSPHTRQSYNSFTIHLCGYLKGWPHKPYGTGRHNCAPFKMQPLFGSVIYGNILFFSLCGICGVWHPNFLPNSFTLVQMLAKSGV